MEGPTFTLIENGEVYAPEYLGRVPVLLSTEKILKVGEIDAEALRRVGLEIDVINAGGCIVTPEFIDPHEHLLGGSGENGFSSQTPEIAASEIVSAGITTVVGCLGADTRMKTLPGLLAKVKGLKEEGLNAHMWSGGYNIPPTCITDSIGGDLMFIDEVIGAGEIAIADERASNPTAHELARLAHETYVACSLNNKAGVLHIHVGDGDERLSLLRTVIADHAVRPEWLYATHINRSEKLMSDAIDLAKDGGFVDIDTVDGGLAECIRLYMEHSGWEEQLTVSSDASISSPQNVLSQWRSCILEHGLPLETMLRLVTSNTARALKLENKGRVAVDMASDVLVLKKSDLELREVISRGRRLIREGKLNFKERFLTESDRHIVLEGEKANGNGANTKPEFTNGHKKERPAETMVCDGK